MGKNNTNECICKTETDSQCRNIVITRGEWEEERNKVGQIINSRYKLPCIKKQAPIIYCIAEVIIAIILQ